MNKRVLNLYNESKENKLFISELEKSDPDYLETTNLYSHRDEYKLLVACIYEG